MGLISPDLGTWGLFVIAFISSTILPGGSEAVLAVLVAKTDLDPIWLLVVATGGNTLGAVTTFGLGFMAYLGIPVERLAGKHHEKALKLIRRWGAPVLLFSWTPVIGDALCLTAGWLRLPFVASLIAITVGKAVRYALVIYAFS